MPRGAGEARPRESARNGEVSEVCKNLARSAESARTGLTSGVRGQGAKSDQMSAKSEGMSRGRVPRLGRETKSVSLLRLREVGCPDQFFLSAAHRRVDLGRRSGRPRWIHWKTVSMLAGKVSYLAVARPSEGERESQIYFLSPRDF